MDFATTQLIFVYAFYESESTFVIHKLKV